MQVFTLINDLVDDAFSAVADQLQVQLQSNVVSLLYVSLTIYLLFFGLLVLYQKVQMPMQEFFFSVLKIVGVIVFIENSGGMLTLASEAVKGLQSLGTSGGSTGVAIFDETLITIMDLAKAEKEKNDDFLVEYIIFGLIAFFGILGLIAPFLMVLIAEITTIVLIAFAPLFLFCLLWGWLKDSFAFYLSALLSNALLIVALTSVMNAFVNIVTTISKNNTVGAVVIIVTMAVGSLLIRYLTSYIAEVIKGIVKVSVDKLTATATASSDMQKAEKAYKQAKVMASAIKEALKK